ncbi:hypothetical protein ACFW9I_02715 [[Kitasatospora] papulosa]|uniref:hypothetical protein n=1 Tax=[Kitasatospora] papulosa TaxID=1464011 RepID=UPI0036772C2B
MNQRSRITGHTAPTTDPDINEALRQVIAGQIGPRTPGVIYDNADGIFEVLAVTTDRDEARRILKRRAAQFAITVHEMTTGTVGPICTVWTGSDRVLKAVAA